ncbi:mitochondrial ribosomal small subunit component [Pyricularia oryzae]|nr:mitochondrial ribosomal small subunit component [Pyricularia oryzae]
MQRLRARDLRAVDLYRTVKSNLDTKFSLPGMPPVREHRQVPPPWLQAMQKIPPSEILTRPIPIQHQKPNPKARKPKNIFRPQKIVYEEDELRKTFYRDHPWELARPRVILEIDGMDSHYCDWSQGLEQPSIPLSGESVVQRQLWLMHNEGMTKEKAYDLVRREFYALRQEEEVERRIAQEEARMVGAYFGKNRLQIGNELEDHEYERWKDWAATEMAKAEAERENAMPTFGGKAKDAEASIDDLMLEGSMDAILEEKKA